MSTISRPISSDAEGRFQFPALVVGGSYSMEAAATGHAAARVSLRVEAGRDLVLPNLVLKVSSFALAGVMCAIDVGSPT